MKFKFIILLIIILITPILAYANDQDIVGIGGSFKILNGENPSVQMVSEIVTMDIYHTYYDVKASFVFLNHGNDVTVKMGFPESGHGDIDLDTAKTAPGFINFSTYVDGKLTPASRTMISVNNDYEDYEAYWVKEVSFKAKQQRQVDVIYRSKVGNIAMPGIFAEYNFTGGNWYGKVTESQFVATLHVPTSYEISYCLGYNAYFSGPKQPRIELKPVGNQLFFSQKNWQAEGNITIILQGPLDWDSINHKLLKATDRTLLDRIKGSWVNENYIHSLVTTKSAIKAMKQVNERTDYQFKIVNNKYVWASRYRDAFDETGFGNYIKDFISLPLKNHFQLVSDDHGQSTDEGEFIINYDFPEVTEFTSIKDKNTKYYLNKAKDLENMANEIILAGKYQDNHGQTYIFGDNEIAK